jgi:hypothetical protein
VAEVALYFALQKSSTANNWPLRSAMPMPAESMSGSRMLARCWGDFMKLWWMAVGLGPSSTFSALRAVVEFDRSQGLKGARLGASGRKQIPRFTRNDKREGRGWGDCFCPMAGSRFLVSLGMTNGRVVAGQELLLSGGR